RLMVGSGGVKLASGDAMWHGLPALPVPYETQPIPTLVAWYAHQLPAWFQDTSTAGVLAIEIGVPWLMFGPRRVRAFAAVVLAALQALIALTGNYAFFNLLTISLCVLLLDDAAFEGAGSARLSAERPARLKGSPYPLRRRLAIAFAIVTVPVSALMFTGSLGISLPGAALAVPAAQLIAPLRSVNSYGLFAVMTTPRDEIVVDGSADGNEWRAYEFPYKPGDVN